MHPESEATRENSLTEMSQVIRARSASQSVLVQGDWNIDLLPSMQGDPCDEPSRIQKHFQERHRLLAWAATHKLELLVPEACVDPHPDCEETLLSPISKASASGARFDLLGHSFGTPGVIRKSWLACKNGTSDHAALINEVMPACLL